MRKIKRYIGSIVFMMMLSLSLWPSTIFAESRFRDWLRERLKRRAEIQTYHPMSANIGLTGCGNGVCEDDETDRNCRQDCCNKFLQEDGDKICMKKGWKKAYVNVDGRPRKLLWKVPEKWKSGAIIILHGGGGGAYSFCGEAYWGKYLVNEAGIEFTEMAISEGFAVFTLDSGYNLATDLEGRPMGKRFDWFVLENRDNLEVPFVENLIDSFIPSIRPDGSSESIFIVGHSTGSFAAIIVSTQLNDKISAFVPVAGGDPYGMYGDMGYIDPIKKMRGCVPGTVRDNETHLLIDVSNACSSETYPNERNWPKTKRKIPFKQFIHEDDGLVDMSCMRKAQKQLISHGYQDDGPFILNRSLDPITPDIPISQGLENHFWQYQYNQPLIEFFKKYANRNRK